MAERIHAPIEANEPTVGNPSLDLDLSDSERKQLPNRNHAVLPLSKPPDHRVDGAHGNLIRPGHSPTTEVTDFSNQ
jgi:hypothetical protein